MRNSLYRYFLLPLSLCLILISTASAQNAYISEPKTPSRQPVTSSLSSLPESDTLFYFSPQRILNDAVPKVVQETDVAKMRASLEDVKRNIGIDLSKIDYAVIAVRFHKPTKELSFVPPDFLVVTSGDFSADSLLTMGHLYLQDKARDEKYGSKTILFMKIDEIATEAEKNPLLKSFVELGAVALNANTVAFGNSEYVKAAIDAADGNGRINSEVVSSLLRDPNALISMAGRPLASFAKSFGMFGTESATRAPSCDTKFGDFYAAVTLDANSFRLRGAMNADNPDTAKIISNLASGLWPAATSAITDQSAVDFFKSVKVSPQNSEVVIEADIPEQTVAKFIRDQKATAKVPAPVTPAKKPVVHRRRRVKK